MEAEPHPEGQQRNRSEKPRTSQKYPCVSGGVSNPEGRKRDRLDSPFWLTCIYTYPSTSGMKYNSTQDHDNITHAPYLEIAPISVANITQLLHILTH